MRRISRFILVVEEGNPNRAHVRFLVDNAALPADCDSYERMVLVFNGEDSNALAAARLAWADCKIPRLYRDLLAGR